MSDVIKHVLMGLFSEPRRAWCGRTLELGVWAFEDANHAALHARAEGRQLVCLSCAKRLSKLLLGHTQHEEAKMRRATARIKREIKSREQRK